MIDSNTINEFYKLDYYRLKKQIVQDLNNTYSQRNKFLKKFPKERIIKFLEHPDNRESQKGLREISNFFYLISPHYRRLIEFFANIPTFNYVLKPSCEPKPVNKFRVAYNQTCYLYRKYRLKSETPKILTKVFLEGIFYGLEYENDDSYILKEFDSAYAEITSIEDGVFRFSIDLNYFVGQDKSFIKSYGTEILNAYYRYVGNPEKDILPNSNERWYEPKKQVCIKYDEELQWSLPPFIGLFLDLIDLDTYKEIQKDGALIDNYRLIHLRVPTDSDGVPKMQFNKAQEYYDLTCSNVPDGVGVAMSPFAVDNLSLKDTNGDNDFVETATTNLFCNAGLNPLLFGLGGNPTSQVLELSLKPDEAIVFKLLKQIANVYNVKFKKSKPDFYIKLEFLEQSIFNKDKVSDSLIKSAQYGCPTKLQYVASVGLLPDEVVNMSVLENDVLGLTTKIFNKPLVSSYTQSGNDTGEAKVGRPTTDNPSDNTERNIENNSNYK